MSFWDSLKENEKQNCIGKILPGTKLSGKWYAPDGAVLKEWNSKIYLAIKTVIHDPGNRVHIFGSSSTHPGFSINLYMMCNSHSRKPARPTVVISCHKKNFAKRTVDLLEKMPTLKRSVLGFDFLGTGGFGIVADHSEAVSPVTQQIGLSLCGARVVISPSETNPFWTQATLGGVIVVDGRSYGLTVAHALVPHQGRARAEDSDVVSANGSASAISNGDDIYDIPTAQSPMPSNGAMLDAEASQTESQSIYLDDQDILPPTSNRVDRVVPKPESLKADNLIGTIKAIASPHELAGGRVNFENDWALFEISSSRAQMPNTVRTPAGEIIQSAKIAPADPNGPVLVATGVSGVLETECPGVVSGIVLPNSTRVLDAWTVTKSCQPGDCGAWVLDRQNGDVFGMIVATSYRSQESYFLPMSKIFDSILALGPNGSTVSFPGASRQADAIDPAHSSHPPCNDPSNCEECRVVSHPAEEPSQSKLQTPSPEIGDRQSAFEPTTLSERLPIDATDQPASKAPKEHVLQAAGDANASEETVVMEEHPPPVRLRWTKVLTKEIPINALDSLGVPWRKVDNELTHIKVDRGFVRALQKAKAQQQPTKTESPPPPPSPIARPSPPPLPIETNQSSRRAPAPEDKSRSETAIDGRPKATSEPKLRVERGSSRRGDDSESHSTEYTETIERRSMLHIIGDDMVEVTKGPGLNKTLIPATLVEDRVLHAFNFAFYVQDGMYHILEALDNDGIDQVIEWSKGYRADQGMPVDQKSGKKVFRRSSNPTQSHRQTTYERYDLLFEGDLMDIFSDTTVPEMDARVLSAASRELVQRFRENREKLSEALTFLEDTNHDGTETRDRRGRSEHLKKVRPGVIIDDPISRPSPSPPRPPPPPPRERSEERIEIIDIRHTGERNRRPYDDDLIIDRNQGGRGGRRAPEPDLPPARREREEIDTREERGPRGYRRDEIQEEADYYNQRAVERSYVGEGLHGATRDWEIVDVPPGTRRVKMDGAGGASQEITWQRYNGVRRSKFMPDRTASDEGYSSEIARPEASPGADGLSVSGNADTKVSESTSKSHAIPEPAVVEREREQPRSKDTNGDQNKRAREKLVRFDSPQEPHTSRSYRTPFTTPTMRVIKNMPEVRYEDVDNAIREARAPHRERESRWRHPEIVVRRKDRERNSPRFVDHDKDYSPEMYYASRPLRRRSPSPSMEEIIIRRKSPSPVREVERDKPPPREIERDREDVIIRRDDREKRDRYDDYEREEVIIRRDEDRYDRRLPPPRDFDRQEIIIRQRKDEKRPPPPEEIIIRQDEREDDRVSRVPIRSHYTNVRSISHERERSRGTDKRPDGWI